MDKEKVITGLELCTNISPDGCLMLCPYKDEKDETYSGFCEQVLKQDALVLLKEQEAVVPGIAQDVDGIFATCGNCKKKLWKMMGLEFVVNPDEMPRFCPHCGKAVKWK